MSKQRAGAAPTTTPRKPRPARPAVGSRSFNRRAQQAQRKAGRRSVRQRTGQAGSTIGTSLRRLPTAAWMCALVAFLSAACWSFVTPPFQVPDEPAHVDYVKQLAENGALPQPGVLSSLEEKVITHDLKQQDVLEVPQRHTIRSEAQQRKLEEDLQAAPGASEKGSAKAGVAASEPPLFYALQTIPYSLGSTLLDKLTLMRLLSALMAAVTALFAFLFVRETLPSERWAWSVGGMCVALVPLFGFMSGSVNPDAGLFAVSAAAFYCIARGFRRGLSRRSAVTLGAVIAIGFATKLNFVGLAPGLLLGLVMLGVRAARTDARDAYRNLAIALTIALSPVVLYIALHVARGEPAVGLVSTTITDMHGSPLKDLSYIWQLYLPRLPGMHNDFFGLSTTRQIWFDGYIGLYGWLDTTFPGWVYEVALIAAGAIGALSLRGLLTARAALTSRAGELAVYLTMAVGLMVLIGADSYLAYPVLNADYGQARYLLPLLPLLGVIVALAARGAGRRWGPAVGVALVMLFLAHDLFSQLQEVARFYG